ncbi:MAG: hypothetical protein BWY45_02648 [Euryarchaeota archaeon ADurb.Bin294]|nr:MAG: hypothetical protein BWY45_02648 [Euryarchaeota archaeon ADurb.Bin294]
MAVMVFILCILITGVIAEDNAEWHIILTGPDGELSVSPADVQNIVEKKGVSVQIDGQELKGAPLWRVLALADTGKTLGPGNIVHISGDTAIEIAYPKIWKNDGYLIIAAQDGPNLYVSAGLAGEGVKKISSIDISETDDWTLQIISSEDVRKISKEMWDDLALQYQKEKETKNGAFSGITISDLLVSQEIIPETDAKINITGQDGYTAQIPWNKISGSSDYLIADKMDGSELPQYIIGLFAPDWPTPAWPLMHIDPEFPGNDSVGNIETIEIL